MVIKKVVPLLPSSYILEGDNLFIHHCIRWFPRIPVSISEPGCVSLQVGCVRVLKLGKRFVMTSGGEQETTVMTCLGTRKE